MPQRQTLRSAFQQIRDDHAKIKPEESKICLDLKSGKNFNVWVSEVHADYIKVKIVDAIAISTMWAIIPYDSIELLSWSVQ